MIKIIAAGLFAATAVPASALQPLHENTAVLNGFYAIGFADEVRKNCETIAPRYIRAYSYLKSLERYAREAGYTEDDVRELRKNKDEKAKLKARIVGDLAERGASPETPEGYCTVGLEEIAKGSAAGRLLRAK